MFLSAVKKKPTTTGKATPATPATDTQKKRAPRKPRAPKRTVAELGFDAVVLYLCHGGEKAKAGAIAQSAGVAPGESDAVISSARAAIAAAAGADRPSQVAAALEKLDRIESGLGDTWNASAAATKLKVVAERSKLLGLYTAREETSSESGGDAVAAEEALAENAQVRSHLIGIGLGSDGLPVGELARIAAMRIMRGPGKVAQKPA